MLISLVEVIPWLRLRKLIFLTLILMEEQWKATLKSEHCKKLLLACKRGSR